MNGKILKKRRLQSGLLQKEVAEAVGVTPGRISQIERKARIRVSDDLAYRLAKIVKAPWGELMNDRETGQQSDVTEVAILGTVPSNARLADYGRGLGYVEVPTVLTQKAKSTNLFALKVVGATLLSDGIGDGDYLVVDKTGIINDGDLGVVYQFENSRL
jgi:SOS-response transcriptional repressor LexA